MSDEKTLEQRVECLENQQQLIKTVLMDQVADLVEYDKKSERHHRMFLAVVLGSVVGWLLGTAAVTIWRLCQ